MLSTFKTPLPKGVAPDGSLQFFLENFSMQLFVDHIYYLSLSLSLSQKIFMTGLVKLITRPKISG
jgi:hypothetical protein